MGFTFILRGKTPHEERVWWYKLGLREHRLLLRGETEEMSLKCWVWRRSGCGKGGRHEESECADGVRDIPNMLEGCST